MKITRNDRRIIGILLIMICLCFLIPLGEQWMLRREQAESAIPAQTEEEALTLETLLGEDYVQFLTDTITMQLENRMEKNPEIRYYPVEQQKPLGDYVTIGEETRFEVDGEGYLVIRLPAGTVTQAAHGEQRFRVARVEEEEAVKP